jgi:hypothetical protein
MSVKDRRAHYPEEIRHGYGGGPFGPRGDRLWSVREGEPAARFCSEAFQAQTPRDP